MKKPFKDLIESSSSDALLNRYRELCLGFSWTNELKGILNGDGKLNIAALALKGLDPDISSQDTAFVVDGSRSGGDTTTVKRDELARMVRKLAGGLKNRLGIQRGEPVAALLPNSIEMALSVLAITYAGAVVCPIIDIYRADPVKSRLKNLKPKTLITSQALMDDLDPADFPFIRTYLYTDRSEKGIRFSDLLNESEAEPEMVEPSRPFIIHYTSGTFGVPKGILHSHNCAPAYFRTAQWVLGLKRSKRLWCTAHPGWMPGSAYGIFGALLNGAGSILTSGKPDFSIIPKLNPTTLYTLPSVIARMASTKEPLDLKGLEVIASTGERLSPSLVASIQERHDIWVQDTWCMTETGMIMIANFPFAPVKLGSAGLPVPGVRAIVVNENEVALPPNTLGILAFEKNWPSLMTGVWGGGKEIDDAFTSKNYVTTDYAYADEDGYIWVQGRGEEFIKRGSERISPYEIEDVLLGHPAISEIAAIPISREGKELLKLFVVLAPGFEGSGEIVESIKRHVKENMGGYAVPDEILFLDELPKTRTGKVLRRSLKAREMNLPEE